MTDKDSHKFLKNFGRLQYFIQAFFKVFRFSISVLCESSFIKRFQINCSDVARLVRSIKEDLITEKES